MTASNTRLSRVREHFFKDPEGPLRDRVYRALRSGILAHELIGGDRITEFDLSTTLDVSRTPLREAFRLLQAEGLVTMSERRGVVVRGLGLQDFLDIYEMRAPLDQLVARKAAQNQDPDFLRKLRDNIEISEFLLDRKRWPELKQQFLLFHTLIQEVCGNARLRDLLQGLQDYTSSAPSITRPTPTHAPSTLADHVRIYEAIKAHDADAAGAAALLHVENERANLQALTSPGAKPATAAK